MLYYSFCKVDNLMNLRILQERKFDDKRCLNRLQQEKKVELEKKYNNNF